MKEDLAGIELTLASKEVHAIENIGTPSLL
jgi:hypothetical protein